MVDDYIRREEMIDAVDHLHIIPSIDGTGKPTPTEDFRVQFIGTVLKVKSADVVEVVRCKDCRKCSYDPLFNYFWCNLTLGTRRVKPDDFCSYGEKRGEE
jgi:hypothetical protein